MNEISKNTVKNEVYEQFLGANFPDIEQKTKIAFLEMARSFNLNPFKREIYLVGYRGKQGDNYNIIVGYEVYISRAMASGKLDGWQVESKIEKTTRFNSDTGQFEEISDLVATCTIWRKDFSHPFKKSVNFSEYAQKTFDYRTKTHRINAMWADKPRTMLEKVATAQAFRLAFPAELGGIGYQAEEIGHDSAANYSLAREVTPHKTPEANNGNDFSQELTLLEGCRDIGYLNAQLEAYRAHRGPAEERAIWRKAIWQNAEENQFFYDEREQKFLTESPIIAAVDEDKGGLNGDFAALDAYRIRLSTAGDLAEIEKITLEISVKYGDAREYWPEGLVDLVNNATKKVQEPGAAQDSEELIF